MLGVPNEHQQTVSVRCLLSYVDIVVNIAASYINAVKETLKANILAFINSEKYEPELTGKAGEAGERSKVLFLEGEYNLIKPGDLIAIRRPNTEKPEAYLVEDARVRPRTAYNLRGNATEVHLERKWWNPGVGAPILKAFEEIQTTRISCEARKLDLAEEPIDPEERSPTELEFGDLVEHLTTGQQLVVEGTPFIKQADTSQPSREIVHIARVSHQCDVNLFGDRYVTHVKLVKALGMRFRTAKVLGNLVKATHGKTNEESVGDGQGTKASLKHRLTNAPLSRLPAPTPSGTRDDLNVFVNDVRWLQDRDFVSASSTKQMFVAVDTVGLVAVTVAIASGRNSVAAAITATCSMTERLPGR
jgi:hypothetical protein